MALFLLASACGSDDPLTGDGVTDKDQDRNPATARDGGAKPGTNKDGGKNDDLPASGAKRDGSTQPSNCGRTTFATGHSTPDMLIVLDRSGSMRPGGNVDISLRCDNIAPFDLATQIACAAAGIDCGNAQDAMTTFCGGTQTRGPVDRWTPSVNAVKTLTARFDQVVSFGLMTFPASRNECGPGDVKVPMGYDTADRIAQVLSSTQPGGGTPTGETLQAALQLFKESEIIGDAVQAPRYVLLVTDGQPTCPNSNGSSNNRQRLEADKQYAIQAIDALAEYGVKTFVVGYDAQLDQNLAQSLREFAQHGGTEDYYPVQNEQSLVAAFDSISQSIVTCTFEFSKPITDPQLLRVTLDNVLLRPDDPNGWVLDGQTITIQGSSCDALQDDSSQHKIDIVLECNPVIYI